MNNNMKKYKLLTRILQWDVGAVVSEGVVKSLCELLGYDSRYHEGFEATFEEIKPEKTVTAQKLCKRTINNAK